jgi:hypothetical protein
VWVCLSLYFIFFSSGQVVKPFDYETEVESWVILTVTDSGQPPQSLDKRLLVTVQDANEPPTSINITNNKVRYWYM